MGVMEVAERVCVVDECGRERQAQGYCWGHYGRWRQGKAMDMPLAPRTGGQAAVERAAETVAAKRAKAAEGDGREPYIFTGVVNRVEKCQPVSDVARPASRAAASRPAACPRCGGRLLSERGDLVCVNGGHGTVWFEAMAWDAAGGSPADWEMGRKEVVQRRRLAQGYTGSVMTPHDRALLAGLIEPREVECEGCGFVLSDEMALVEHVNWVHSSVDAEAAAKRLALPLRLVLGWRAEGAARGVRVLEPPAESGLPSDVVARPAAVGCSVEGCERKNKSHGYCFMHWGRVKRSGDPGPAEAVQVKGAMRGCSMEGCAGAHVARGLCVNHYAAWRRDERERERISKRPRKAVEGMGLDVNEEVAMASVGGEAEPVRHVYSGDYWFSRARWHLALRCSDGELLVVHLGGRSKAGLVELLEEEGE